ncbi:MAG TPA: BON domain-containing protein [Burkholderiales bacterium]|nr:BON domain-containing protein [Burkholderiales bacterium]
MAFLPLAGLALGAAGMYLFDPEQGRSRRSKLRDKLDSQSRRWRNAAKTTAQDLRNRTRGTSHELWASMEKGRVPDRVLVERVRAKIGRYVSHPSAIQVTARNGQVTLSGLVLEGEHDDLLRVVRDVRGVQEVQDRLQREGGGEGKARMRAALGLGKLNFLQERWNPSTRAVSGAAGTALMLTGLRRGGLIGVASGIAGAAMLVRAATNRPLTQLANQLGQDDRSTRMSHSRSGVSVATPGGATAGRDRTSQPDEGPYTDSARGTTEQPVTGQGAGSAAASGSKS